MRKTAIAMLALIVTLGITTGCGGSGTDPQMQALDDAIHDVESRIGSFYLLGPSASPSEVESAMRRLSADWSVVEEAAVDIDELAAALDSARAAFAELEAAAAAVASGDTSAEMQAVFNRLQTFEDAVEELHEAGGFHD